MTLEQDIRVERLLAIGCIVSKSFLSRTYNQIDTHLLQSDYIRSVVKWCIEYHIKYKDSPGQNIVEIFKEKYEKNLIKEDYLENIERFLSSIHHENENQQFNENYVLDQVKDYFVKQRIEQTNETVKDLIESGDVEEANSVLREFNRNNKFLETHASDDEPFEDTDLMEQSLYRQQKPLFTYTGAFGDIVNPELYRGAFVALQAPPKTGKSYWLMEFAIRGLRAGCNVALFQVGDMDRYQSMRRLLVYLTKKSTMKKYTGEILVPVLDCEHNQMDTCSFKERTCSTGIIEDLKKNTVMDFKLAQKMKYKSCSICRRIESKKEHYKGAVWYQKNIQEHVLNLKEAKESMRLFKERYMHKNKFKRSVHPSKTVTVEMINNKLENWELGGFIPDLIVIDYADNLISHAKTDYRNKVSDIWADLRSLSLERNNLLITATQANAESIRTGENTASTFSEDFRKFNHVTATFAINRTEEERRKKVSRISKIICREDEFFSDKHVTILQCLPLGRPYLGSY